MNHVITFDDDGTANTLWTDKLPLAELGTMKVKRASWIDFNEGTQKWEICPHHPSYFHDDVPRKIPWRARSAVPRFSSSRVEFI